jgi:hypothetical protein
MYSCKVRTVPEPSGIVSVAANRESECTLTEIFAPGTVVPQASASATRTWYTMVKALTDAVEKFGAATKLSSARQSPCPPLPIEVGETSLPADGKAATGPWSANVGSALQNVDTMKYVLFRNTSAAFADGVCQASEVYIGICSGAIHTDVGSNAVAYPHSPSGGSCEAVGTAVALGWLAVGALAEHPVKARAKDNAAIVLPRLTAILASLV